MKKTLLSVITICTVITIGFTLSSCDEKLGVEIGIPQTIETVYRVDPQTGTTFTRIDTFTVDLDSLLASQDATRDDIESITTSSTSLGISDSLGNIISTANFTNVKSFIVKVENGGNGISTILNYDSTAMVNFGTANPIVSNATNVQSGIDLLAYFVDGTFTVGESINLYAPITAPVYVKSVITVTVTVKL